MRIRAYASDRATEGSEPMSSMSPMSQQQTDDLKRDVQASLEARRELGPAYDDHFIQQLTERMMAQVRQEMARIPQRPAPRSKLDSSQRTGVAICSLIFGIPLIAITASQGFAFFIAVIAMIALINFFTSL
jgi:hypothetical protein